MSMALDYEARPTPGKRPHPIRGLLLLGALPLLIYPFCLMANLMGFAAPTPPRGVFKAFLWSSTLYPIAYLPAAGVAAVLASNDRLRAARVFAGLPLLYLLGVLICLAVAMHRS